MIEKPPMAYSKLVNKFIWKFQKFKVMNDNQVRKISPSVGGRSKSEKLIENRPKIILVAKEESFQDTTFCQDSTMSVRIQMSGSMDMINLLADYGFEELKYLVIDEPVD